MLRPAMLILALGLPLVGGCDHPAAGDVDLGVDDLGVDDLVQQDVQGAPQDLAPSADDLASQDGAAMAACPVGSSLLRTLSCAAGVAVPTALATAVGVAVRGDIVSLGAVAEGTLPCLPATICRPDNAPTLIFSDEPESPSASGILYAATIAAGRYRVYVYHTNGAVSGRRKFPVVVFNQGAADVNISLGQRGIAGPSSAYIATGAATAASWLDSPGGGTLTVPAGARVLLDADLDSRHAAYGELVVAQLDFVSDGTLKLSVVSVDESTDSVTATAGLSLLPNDGAHVRGTFAGADLLIVPYGTSWPLDGLRHLRLGSGDGEPILDGVDAVDGDVPVMLFGNYGVRYRYAVAGGHFALACSPRGGAWAGAARVPPGVDSVTSMVALPGTMTSISDGTTMAFAGRFAAGSSAELELLHAGGSSLPVDLVLVPVP